MDRGDLYIVICLRKQFISITGCSKAHQIYWTTLGSREECTISFCHTGTFTSHIECSDSKTKEINYCQQMCNINREK